MRHRLSNRQLSRSSSHRGALFRNMTTSLLRYERFETTIPKAKELRRFVEPLIRLARADSLAARRKAYSFIYDKAIVHKLFTDIGPRFKARLGGYTRILKTGVRHGDAAEMAIVELLSEDKKQPSSVVSTSGDKASGSEKKDSSKAKKTASKKTASKNAAKKAE